jgi:predicted nucleotidyltransferase
MGGKSRQSLGSGIAHALRDVAKVLDAHEGRAALIGGMAVIARGVQRVTRDIDIAVAGAALVNAALADEMQQHGMSPRISDAVAFADENQVLLMRHDATGVDIDVSRAWLPFEIEALASADHESLAGIDIVIAKPEDLIIFKSVAWRPQDQQDVERLLTLYGDRVDLARIRRHVRELGEAIEEDRLAALDALLARLRVGDR